jgi:hypothetical protein
VKNLHDASIQEHIRQKAGWDTSHFNHVHWDAHERAFRTLPRFTRYNNAKLIRRLINTNNQNNFYYGTSPLCPICEQEIETKKHVFKCSHPSTASNVKPPRTPHGAPRDPQTGQPRPKYSEDHQLWLHRLVKRSTGTGQTPYSGIPTRPGRRPNDCIP